MTPKRFYFGMIGLVVLLVVGGGVGYWFFNKKLQNNILQLQSRQVEINLADERAEGLKRLEKQLAELDNQLVPISEVLPSDKKQSELLDSLTSAAGISGLTVESITFAPTEGLPGPSSQTEQFQKTKLLVMPVTVQARGTYLELQSFLERVEAAVRMQSVNTLSVSVPDKAEAGELTFNITLDAYLQP